MTATAVSTILDEGAIGLAAAARILGTIRVGAPVHPSTVGRWAVRGVMVNGEVVRLESLRVGGRMCTSRPALLRFLERQNATEDAPAIRSPAACSKASAAASAELVADGM